MKKIVLLIIGLGIFGVVYFFVNKSTESGETLRIAIFTPTTHLALEEIEQGFKDTVEKGSLKSCVFTTFNANGNKTLLRAQAEEIVVGGYDLIFTIGTTCSQTTAELLHKKDILTPHFFGGVDGPEFAQSLKDLNEFSTGVYVHADYKGQITMLHAIKPTAKNVLLVYDPAHGTGLEKDKQEIEQYLASFGMSLRVIEVYQSNEIQQKVAAQLSLVDVVLVLTDNTVVAGIDALITLCNRHAILLFASDLSSGQKGAAAAYGITEYESGSGAGQQAVALIKEGKKPANLPVKAVTGYRLEINKETMKQQGLELSPDQLELYKPERDK